MTRADRHLLRRVTTAMNWLAVVAFALVVTRPVHAEEADLPSPYPSEAWSPPVSLKPLFAPPPCAASDASSGNIVPRFDPPAQLFPSSSEDFSPTPLCDQPYNACEELDVYGGKHLNETQRPWIEL